jgi:putative nucleotidyltransferase with HDIG domain
MDQEVVNALVRVVEMKDDSTAAHTWRVTLYAKSMAESFGLDHESVACIMQGAVLHDIGKIDIPSKILGKPGRLTDEEFDVIKTHTVIGYDRLVRMGEDDPLILAIVRSHHERLDGSGYPDGLKGPDILFPARCFAVIDSFDAMTSLRPYRKETGPAAASKAIAEIESKTGTWYCPEAVRLFTNLYDSGELDWILEYFNDQKSMDALALDSAPDVGAVQRARHAPLGSA